MLRRFILVAACVCTLVAAPVWSQGGLAEGREAFETYLEATNAYTEAIGAGDAEAAREHVETAKVALTQARRFLELGRADRSDDVETLASYAAVLGLTKDFDLATKVYRRLSERTPADAAVWLNLGKSLSAMGESKEAVGAFGQCIELSGGGDQEAQARIELGDLYLERGAHMLAEEQYLAALEASGESIMAKIALAALDARLGMAVEANKKLEELGDLGTLYGAPIQLRVSNALKDFDEARLWVPDDAENHLAYAKLLTRAGRAAEAIAPLRRSLALDGQNYVGWNLLGSLYGQIGDTQGAQNAFVRSLEVNADQPRTYEALESLGGTAR